MCKCTYVNIYWIYFYIQEMFLLDFVPNGTKNHVSISLLQQQLQLYTFILLLLLLLLPLLTHTDTHKDTYIYTCNICNRAYMNSEFH